jgi:hypothetical protein
MTVAFLWQHWTLILLRDMCKPVTMQREPLLQRWALILLRYMSATIQREPLLRFRDKAEHLYCWEIYMSVTIQREPLLNFHGNAEHLYCWERYVSNNTKRTIVAFPWQRWALVLSRDICKSATIQRELILRFHGNSGYAVAPQCCIERTLPILFFYEGRPSPTNTPAREVWFGAPH